jgi:hypothetical protein
MRKLIAASVAGSLMLLASTGVSASLGQFVGKWENVDAKTGGLTRLEITAAGNKVKVHAYGSCEPSACDWGEVEGVAYAPSFESDVAATAQAITASYAGGKTIVVIRQVEGNRLQAETFTRFTDNSGRAAYTAVYTFARGR